MTAKAHERRDQPHRNTLISGVDSARPTRQDEFSDFEVGVTTWNESPTFRCSPDADMDVSQPLGSKALTLHRLAVVGFRIPPEFVVTAGEFARQRDDLDAVLRDAADVIGPGPFAVRSSAAAEDLPAASCAGLYETFLDVDRDNLKDAVSRCLQSALKDRVAAYGAAHADPPEGASNPQAWRSLSSRWCSPLLPESLSRPTR